ncbi:hypothetical protein Psuf_011230 [Phytohabitans suffuscus]|uniref:Uncharacterized protein n=1 Tax=Phytohabitans suffuscus TaxID=624315 RepID=A0A6F8YCM0_9ACTN|nr:hypothetical protein [Phytohabitans suffuscus]BCB83810.1 hypothetical protein Psuf_011230 [Phytohabitans suffuscus]
MTDTTRLASAADPERYGEYRFARRPGDRRPLYRLTGRVTADGSSGFAAEPGRYHIYSGWFCPWAQRTLITRALAGLEDVVSVSYVDNKRDGRGGRSGRPTGRTRSTASPSCVRRTRRPSQASTATCRCRRCGTGRAGRS